MRAIVIKQYGGPEVLAVEDRLAPEPKPGHVVIEVKAFGLNRAETYMRSGAWGNVAEISGIECRHREIRSRRKVRSRSKGHGTDGRDGAADQR